MININGKYNKAKVFTDNIEEKAKLQVETICNLEIFKDSKIRIMPDVHAGAGCTIGTTMTITDYIIPNLVGVDIGCGMEVIQIKEKELDLQKVDDVIRKNIPSGRNVHLEKLVDFPKLKDLFCYKKLKDIKRIENSLGSLGGGNHFIEINRDSKNNLYIVVHSGSRNLGTQVAEYYQNIAYDISCEKELFNNRKIELIKQYKQEGKENLLEDAIYTLEMNNRTKNSYIDKNLAYLNGEYFDMYINDMKICQEYATLNRETMIKILVENLGVTVTQQFTTIHNYIDMDTMILRKGAVSAKNGEKLLIPINMRDGSLICIGKGNEDWNNSAPHGAGRLMSRSEALKKLSLAEYKNSMAGIYTSCISTKTLDEAPSAYKPMDEIIKNINPTADIKEIIAPIYNFKASE